MNRRNSASGVSLGCNTVSSITDSTMMGIAEIEISTRIGHNRAARMSGRFLKGPVPMPTISQASRLGGRALAVYLAIHHQTALTGKATITLPRSLLESMGIDKDAKLVLSTRWRPLP
jgi:hypothetical protein